MRFDSVAFLIFAPIVFLLYRIFPQRIRWFLLLCASYVFYGFYAPSSLFVIIAVTLISYVCARKTYSAYEKVMKKVYTVIPIVAAIAFLFVYKYFEFVYGGIASVFSYFGVSDISLDLIVPIGISFFTLRAISYAVEVYKENMKPEKHIGYFALYLSFFPTLLAGPIEKPDGLIRQFRAKKYFAPYDTAYGLKMIAIGFFKVLAVSKQIAVCVDTVFARANSADVNVINGFTVLLATLMFAVQIYCDFSGYCDIATGCASLLGIDLKRNYNAPYLATGMRDLYSRWNITLGDWFKEYVYGAMGGAERSRVRGYINLAIMFILVGLWYGAGVNFILFGAMHFVLYLVCELTEKKRGELASKLKLGKKSKLWVLVKRTATVLTACFTLLLFRAESLKTYGILVYKLFTGWSKINVLASLNSVGFSTLSFATALIAILVVYLLDRQACGDALTVADERLEVHRAQSYITLAWTIAVAWLILFVSGQSNAYTYFIF